MKKNIAILIPTLANGGAERVASNLSLYLPEEYERYIILFDGSKIDYPYKGNIINLNLVSAKNPVSKLILLIKRIIKVREIKKNHNIHFTISFLESPNVINIFSRYKDRVIVSVRSYRFKLPRGFWGKLYKSLIKVIYNRADTIIAVSKVIKANLVKNFGIKDSTVKVIYNPYDVEKIRFLMNEELEAEHKDIFKNNVIVNVGRLTEAKGQWHLIRAFKLVKEEIPDVKLVIIGDGELKEYLVNLANDLSLEKDIFFLNFQKNPFKFISKAKLFILPSLFEGFPNALVEAMACGIPIISSDCRSGPREILGPEKDIEYETKAIEYAQFGVLVPVCDGKKYNAYDKITEEEIQLSKSIIRLLTSNSDRIHYANRANDRAKDFVLEKIIPQFYQ